MYIILGATGHIGSAVAETLLSRGEEVTLVTRNESKAADWKQKGANVAVADVRDVERLRQVFQQGKRLFLLNPPALPDTDTVKEERKSLSAIITALQGSGIEKIVAESTYGAQPGEGIGDLGVLFEMEQEVAKTGIPASIIRGAYYMSNWEGYLESAGNEGKIFTFYPTDFKLPMVDPADIGRFAAGLLTEPIEQTGLYYFEGPAHYNASDVADAFAKALDKKVEAISLKRHDWVPFMAQIGFSEEAARSMAAMTDITLQAKFEVGYKPIKGETTIYEYVTKLVRATSDAAG